jgi:perosamine synthetase
MKNIFLHEPYFFSNELKNISQCIKTGWVSTGGKFVKDFENKLCKYTNSKYAVALNSGTSALDLAIKSISIEKKNEIIVPTITFIAPINTILYNDCSPVFMDVDRYGNLDALKLKNFLNNETYSKNNFTYNKKTKKKIRAIIVVHVFGNISNIVEIVKICKKKNIKVIEDASESLGSFLKKDDNFKHSGTFGDIGCISFNANKIITTGSGGAIITDQKKIFEKIHYLSTQAKDDAINFIHNDVGYNMKLNNLCAAIGVSQINVIDKILNKKRKIHNYYKKYINKIENFEVISPSKNVKSNNWINLLRLKNLKTPKYKEMIIKFFFKENIQVRPIWYPNHLQKKMTKYQRFELKKFKVFFDSVICLPSGYDIKKNEQDKVIDILLKFKKKYL